MSRQGLPTNFKSQKVKSVCQYKYLGILLDTELSDDKDIQRQLRYQYCAANKLRASFSCCSNAVKNVLLRSFCTPMYASQLWCKFRKSCMQRLHMAYNFGCRALYNLPWRASVSSHQVQYNILTFEALQWKTSTCFSKDSENLLTSCGYTWFDAVDCLCLSLFFEHYNHILLWMSDRTLQCLFDWWLVKSQCIHILPRLDQLRIWCSIPQ